MLTIVRWLETCEIFFFEDQKYLIPFLKQSALYTRLSLSLSRNESGEINEFVVTVSDILSSVD